MQAGPDELRRNALVSLLVQCTKREAFHTLRTVEQLGYMVGLFLCLLLLLLAAVAPGTGCRPHVMPWLPCW